MKQTRPIIHGIDHLPDGPDPIPGLLAGPGGGGGPSYPDYITTLASLHGLRGQWKLGEGNVTYQDTSPARNPPYTDMTNLYHRGAGIVAPTTNSTPGLLPLDVDDGAIEFNDQGPTVGYWLGPTGAGASAHDFHPNVPFTANALILPVAPTTTHAGPVIAVSSSNFGPGDPWIGWAVEVAFVASAPALALGFRHYVIGGPNYYFQTATLLSVNERHMVTMTRDGSKNVKLYVDGSPVATGLDLNDMFAMSSYFYLSIGGYDAFSQAQCFYGVVDEVTLWAAALTDDEILGLYESAFGPPAGSVPVYDGSGISWELPTFAVTY
jgi:hypothetical protein